MATPVNSPTTDLSTASSN
jgi:hypothetical protein